MSDDSELDKPESQWTKGQWRGEALRLREELATATAFAMTPPQQIVVNDAEAAEKIRQLSRRIHQLASGRQGKQLEAIRSALGGVRAPVDEVGLERLRGLVRY